MNLLAIPKGSRVLLGRAANPMPPIVSNAIGEIVRSTGGIREAYLPQCYVESIVDPPAQVLVLVLNTEANPQSIVEAVGENLSRVLPAGMHLDVWAMDQCNGFLSTVRGTRTHVHCAPPPEKKPWWRVFGS
jgi:hypothetical protein